MMFSLSAKRASNVQLIKKINHYTLSFVPKFTPCNDREVDELKDFVKNHKSIVVITGAGISTESGIPDYRSEEVGLYARTNHKPVQYNEFLKSQYIRQRYWARNYVGWSRFSQIEPNDVHKILTKLENLGKVSCIITQNVDNLHGKAGSKNIIELHGTSYEVKCLSCKTAIPREEFQKVLAEKNPHMHFHTTMIRPDGDVEIPEDHIKNFQVPPCSRCRGILKPYIIFFGDNVPKERVLTVQSEISKAHGVLVLGSSLSTFSGYRLILQAKEEKKKVAIVNIGPTRADKEADLKISTKCGDILPKILESLSINC